MGPRRPSRAPKYQEPTSAKALKDHGFSKVFGGPRLSKTASKDSRRLPRGYLGFLRAILSHLGAILKTRAFKRAPAGCNRWGPSPSWQILGSISEPKMGLSLNFWGSFWGQVFGQFLDNFGGSFGGHFGARSAQEGAKMSPREPLRTSNTQKAAFAKTSKNLRFLGSRGIPKEP